MSRSRIATYQAKFLATTRLRIPGLNCVLQYVIGLSVKYHCPSIWLDSAKLWLWLLLTHSMRIHKFCVIVASIRKRSYPNKRQLLFRTDLPTVWNFENFRSLRERFGTLCQFTGRVYMHCPFSERELGRIESQFPPAWKLLRFYNRTFVSVANQRIYHWISTFPSAVECIQVHRDPTMMWWLYEAGDSRYAWAERCDTEKCPLWRNANQGILLMC